MCLIPWGGRQAADDVMRNMKEGLVCEFMGLCPIQKLVVLERDCCEGLRGKLWLHACSKS